mmetsp:Transcript_29941/g.71881  ORF Transcript_29941/g.71881 Transcript_29941/m.71881 type:complete len:141 (+) Transcript_29941:1-423(+)
MGGVPPRRPDSAPVATLPVGDYLDGNQPRQLMDRSPSVTPSPLAAPADWGIGDIEEVEQLLPVAEQSVASRKSLKEAIKFDAPAFDTALGPTHLVPRLRPIRLNRASQMRSRAQHQRMPNAMLDSALAPRRAHRSAGSGN